MGPQASGQGEAVDTKATAKASRTLLNPEQLLLICGERGRVSNPPCPDVRLKPASSSSKLGTSRRKLVPNGIRVSENSKRSDLI